MFRQIVEAYVEDARLRNPGNPNPRAIALADIDALRYQPSFTIASYMELWWANRARARLLNGIDIRGEPFLVPVPPVPPATGWDHLIYAYLIENSRIYDVVGRVIRELTTGERLAIPLREESYDWLRTTEEVFYSYGIPFLSSSIVSQIRPDVRATRRNAYYRMFGVDLNHGADDQRAYPYDKPAAANRSFVATLEAFLRETWRAIENSLNVAGANPTDAAAVADQALRLQNMMNERRGNGAAAPNLAREEFAAVCAMQWLELVIADDTPLVQDLQVGAASPEERLRKMGDRVGLPSHASSHSYFLLAQPMSVLFSAIEQGAYSTPGGAERLYLPADATNPRRSDMMLIIDQWSRATGRSMKATPVAPSATVTTTPRQAMAPRPVAPTSPNGSGNGAATTSGQLVKV